VFVVDTNVLILCSQRRLPEQRVYTRDADFHRFPFVEVIDPLA
jgi:predicted nucleic acid-binding protein